jgi:hypothetical protein
MMAPRQRQRRLEAVHLRLVQSAKRLERAFEQIVSRAVPHVADSAVRQRKERQQADIGIGVANIDLIRGPSEYAHQPSSRQIVSSDGGRMPRYLSRAARGTGSEQVASPMASMNT